MLILTETCQRSHQTIRGCTPVELYVLGRSLLCFATGTAVSFCLSLSLGEGAPCREAGGNKKEVRKDPHSKVGRLPLQGESVLAVRQNWNVYCIRKDVRLESVGTLPFTVKQLFPHVGKSFSSRGRKKDNRTGRIPV